MNSDRLLARNRIARAWSSGSPRRPTRRPDRPEVPAAGVEGLVVDLLRLREVGPDAVDAHAAPGDVDGEALGEVDHRGLERAVHGIGRVAARAFDRRHVDDRAALLLEHRRQERVRDPEDVEQVDLVELLPHLGLALVERPHAQVVPDVVHEHVDASVRAEHVLPEPVDVGVDAHVGGERVGVATARRRSRRPPRTRLPRRCRRSPPLLRARRRARRSPGRSRARRR